MNEQIKSSSGLQQSKPLPDKTKEYGEQLQRLTIALSNLKKDVKMSKYRIYNPQGQPGNVIINQYHPYTEGDCNEHSYDMNDQQEEWTTTYEKPANETDEFTAACYDE